MKAGSARICCELQKIVVREWSGWYDYNWIKIKFKAVGTVLHAGLHRAVLRRLGGKDSFDVTELVVLRIQC